MRVTKSQIVNGITAYIRDDVLPKMEDDRALQIVFSVAVNAVRANDKLIDRLFDNELVKALVDDDGSGRYEIGGLVDWIKSSIEEYGSFPIAIPPIPLISPREISIKLDASDIAAIRRRIEASVDE